MVNIENPPPRGCGTLTKGDRACFFSEAPGRRSPNCAPRRLGLFQFFFFFNLCVLFFQTATSFLGQTVIKLFGPNYLIHRSVSCFFWPRSALKIRWNAKVPVNRESSGTAVPSSTGGRPPTPGRLAVRNQAKKQRIGPLTLLGVGRGTDHPTL
jgi:hypothetical protein